VSRSRKPRFSPSRGLIIFGGGAAFLQALSERRSRSTSLAPTHHGEAKETGAEESQGGGLRGGLYVAKRKQRFRGEASKIRRDILPASSFRQSGDKACGARGVVGRIGHNKHVGAAQAVVLGENHVAERASHRVSQVHSPGKSTRKD